MKSLSVIIPTYNSCGHLPKCLVSVLENISGIQDAEIIIVDDASTDNGRTRKMLRSYAQQYKIIRPIYLKKNLGTAGARNIGLRAASGKYVCFIDDDDCVGVSISAWRRNLFCDAKDRERFFSAMMRKTDDNPDIVLCSRCYGLRSDEWSGISGFGLLQNERWRNVIQMYNIEYMTGFLYRRNFLKKHNLYFSRELPLNDDMLFAAMSGYLADKIVVENSAIYRYNYRLESQDHAIDPIKHAKIMRDYIVTMTAVITVMMMRAGDFWGLARFHAHMKANIKEQNTSTISCFENNPNIGDLVINRSEILPLHCSGVYGLCNECNWWKTCGGKNLKQFAMFQIHKYMPKYYGRITR